jgi:hypothetical protein
VTRYVSAATAPSRHRTMNIRSSRRKTRTYAPNWIGARIRPRTEPDLGSPSTGERRTCRFIPADSRPGNRNHLKRKTQSDRHTISPRPARAFSFKLSHSAGIASGNSNPAPALETAALRALVRKKSEESGDYPEHLKVGVKCATLSVSRKASTKKRA